jgi:cyclic pyranopterin phosphate synthase
LNNAGLKRINISLDALDKAIYQQINEVNTPLEDVLAGIDHALDAGFEAVKVNMVVQNGINDSDILPMVRRFRNTGVILRFIEFMDVGNHNQWSNDQVFTSAQIINLIQQEFPLETVDANYHGEVAQRWSYQDGAGEIGVISSISQPFCGDCARARLSAVGELFTCLFATSGFDLRSLVRAGYDDVVLQQRIEKIWTERDDRYSEIRFSPENLVREHDEKQKVEMSYIGG